MVFDAEQAVDVVRRAAPVAGTVWLQTTTVGVEGAGHTIAAARELGLVLVDCPVLGTRRPAEDGALVMLASGPEEVREQLAPVLDAVGSRTLWLGPAGAGSRLKLVCNAWVLSVTAAAAQSIALAQGLGVDPQQFLEAIRGGASDTPYAHVKGAQMIGDDHPVSFSLAGATKDARLISAAVQEAGVAGELSAAVLALLERAGEHVPAAEVDVSAVATAFGGRAVGQPPDPAGSPST